MDQLALYDRNVLFMIAEFLDYSPKTILLVVRGLTQQNHIQTIDSMLPYGISQTCKREDCYIIGRYVTTSENLEKIVGEEVLEEIKKSKPAIYDRYNKKHKCHLPYAQRTVIDTLRGMENININKTNELFILNSSSKYLFGYIERDNTITKVVAPKMYLSTYKMLKSFNILDITPMEDKLITDTYIIPENEATPGAWAMLSSNYMGSST